jgi:hypothetical protein
MDDEAVDSDVFSILIFYSTMKLTN